MRSLLLSVITLTSISLSQAAVYNPLPIQTGSYNADLIVESNATPRLDVVTTATVDNGTNNTANTWFEQGFDTANPGNGLPPANTVFTAQGNANYSFRTPPTYAGPNGILIDTQVTNGTFTLTAPAAYNLLSFLGSGGNGGDVIGVRVNHADGTSETGSFGCPDWFNGTGIAYIAGGRCQNPVTFTTETDGANPRIYFRDVVLANTTSAVTNIVLTYLSGGSSSHNDILGVSGATTPGGPVAPIAVTGYTYDFVVEASAAKRGLVVANGTSTQATTQTMDNDANTGFTFYERGHDFNMINNGPVIYGDALVNSIAQKSGIPVHGTTFTNAAGDHVYTMAPDYTVNDVVWGSPTVPNATITLVTPTAASSLSFLDAAGNGPVSPMVIVHHQDGSSETNSIIIQDWFSSATPIYIPNGRVDTGSGQWSQQLFAGNGADRLFSSDLPLANVVSPVTSIDLVYTNTGGRAGIFAVSALAGAVPPIFTQQPAGTNTVAGNDVFLSAQVSGTAPFTFQWQKGTNGSYATLNNGGNVSGATTTNLSVTSADYFADAADYRIVASNAGGSVTSSVATVVLFSTNTDVTLPGDPISAFSVSLFGDGAVSHAIDNDLGQKFGANITIGTPFGCVVTPSVGPTLVTALRFFTANDAPERDPADYKLEGSINGGSTYTLIASNSMTMPDGRNNSGAPDPLTKFGQEVHFSNANGYSSYRLTFSRLKGGAGQGSFQIGEIELLGVTTNLSVFASVPSTAKAYQGSPVSIVATVSGTPPPTSRWQKQIAGNFTDLSDGGTISGSHTSTLNINPAALSDSGQYRVIATGTSTAVTSSVVQVTVYSTNTDVTTPADPITDFGNTSSTVASPGFAINEFFLAFVTRGSGLNNNAGFPPFAGPVGLVVTPNAGATRLSGLRLYTGSDASDNDPADVKLEGSNNGGTSYTTLLPTTALSLPDDRNTSGAIDPLNSAVQEINFVNSQAYTSYRVTFNHTKNDNAANSLSLGEMELLGVPIPVISGAEISGGNFNISGSGGTPGGGFTVLTNASLTVPVASWGVATTGNFDGSGNYSVSIPVSPASPRLFYTIRVP
jgi:hypothetical protein